MGNAYRAIALVSVMGAGLVLAGACDDPTGPPFSFTEPVALVRLVGQMGADAVGRVHVIGLEAHKFLGSSARVGEAFSGAGLSAVRKTLYLTGFGCCDGWKSSLGTEILQRTAGCGRVDFERNGAAPEQRTDLQNNGSLRPEQRNPQTQRKRPS